MVWRIIMKNVKKHAQKASLKSPLTVATVVSLAAVVMSGCASTDSLYAQYDDSCDIPKPKVKVVERVVEKVRVKKEYVTKYKTKVVTKYKTKVVPRPMSGIRWEPAVYFGFDVSDLTQAAMTRLDADIAVLRKHGNLKLNVQSFTDVKGSNAYNRKLALRRQQAVISYLIDSGITKARIRVSPLGEELPILGQSVSERSINRRVELMLLDQSGRPLALEIKPKQSGFKPPMPLR